MIVFLLRRYGLAVAIVFVVADVLVGLTVGARLAAWELDVIRDAWSAE